MKSGSYNMFLLFCCGGQDVVGQSRQCQSMKWAFTTIPLNEGCECDEIRLGIAEQEQIKKNQKEIKLIKHSGPGKNL
jgi:hypothetical protein